MNNRGVFPIAGVLLIALGFVALVNMYAAHREKQMEQYEAMMDETTHVMKVARR